MHDNLIKEGQRSSVALQITHKNSVRSPKDEKSAEVHLGLVKTRKDSIVHIKDNL